jgi:hypothetical protein
VASVSNRATQVLTAVAWVGAAVALAGWHHASEELRNSRTQFAGSLLEPIARLSRENQAIVRELQGEAFAEKDSGILQSYLLKIRRDGVARTAPMKQRLDQLAENNTALIALLAAYTPHARTSAFAPAADRFRTYAVAWCDRWNSVMELFMAGGDYPTAGVPFPDSFSEAVRAEIAAVP